MRTGPEYGGGVSAERVLMPRLPQAHSTVCERRQAGPQVCTCGYAEVLELQQALLDLERAAVR